MNDDANPEIARLSEGDYEVMVVDVEARDDAVGGGGAELSLVILKGALKGQVLDLRHPSAPEDLLGLLGAHGMLTATVEGLRLHLED